MRRQYLVAAVPAAALVLAPLLPFLRTTDRWLGLPPLLVWLLVWCVLVTPTLLYLERGVARREQEAEGEENAG